MLNRSIFHKFKFTNIVNELYDHFILDMAIISISGNCWTHIHEKIWLSIDFPLNLHQGDIRCINAMVIVSQTLLRTFTMLWVLFSLSVVYIINSKLISCDQKNVIKIWSKPLMYFTSSFDNNASALLSLFQAKTIWYLLLKNH
jgi:hypothetical protein